MDSFGQCILPFIGNLTVQIFGGKNDLCIVLSEEPSRVLVAGDFNVTVSSSVTSSIEFYSNCSISYSLILDFAHKVKQGEPVNVTIKMHLQSKKTLHFRIICSKESYLYISLHLRIRQCRK